ncbi:MAG: hypothetical protein RIE86_27800 [Imperialibacter sp.]|uniref:toxin-antitoxin system YwqK family antitoxin n=1 Tax=Imperialibacter sp. TaxID=2038411 RepID=UPI0032EEEE31
MKHAIFITFLLVNLASCDQFDKKKVAGGKSEAIKNGTDIKYRKDGSILSEANYVDGELNGEAINYYENGKVKTRLNYLKGKKEGLTTMYYETGEKYRETQYFDNKREGEVITYHKNGKVAAKISYHEDFAGKGLVEFLSSGKQKTSYPDLKIEPIDNLSSRGEYLLKIYFEKDRKRAKYYVGDLTEGRFLNNNLTEIPVKDGYAIMKFNPPAPGSFTMQKLNIVGKWQTPTNNIYIVTKTYNLAIDF